MELTSALFANLPKELQDKVLDKLESYYEDWSDYPAYRLTVDKKQVSEVDEPVLDWLDLSFDALPNPFPARKLLSPFAQRWAYQISRRKGPNCWHSSMASIFKGWNEARYMPPQEFTCHVEKSFREIEEPSKLGDLIRLRTSNGREIHGFTYLGVDSEDPDKAIVFTKNGYSIGHYLFMSLASVKKIYQGSGKQISFHRAEKSAIDPSESKDSPCFKEYDEHMLNAMKEEPLDPVIEFGIQKKPTRELEPIQF